MENQDTCPEDFRRSINELPKLDAALSSPAEWDMSKLNFGESAEFNATLRDMSPNPIVVINPDSSIGYVNPAFEKLTGYSAHDVIGIKPPFPWWIDEYKEQPDRVFNASRSGVRHRMEMHMRNKAGEEFWVELTAVPVIINGKYKYHLSNWVDITERKQADTALRESEKRFRELVEMLPEGIFEADLNGHITLANKEILKIFGCQSMDYFNTDLLNLVIPEDRGRAANNLNKRTAGENLGNIEYTAVRMDGSRFSIIVNIVPIRNSIGEITGLRGTLTDITPRKRIEDELRASENFSNHLLSNSPNPLMLIGSDSSIIYVNPATEKLTGFCSQELVGTREPYPYWPEDKIAEYQLSIRDRLKSESNFTIERCFRKKNGDLFWVELSTNPMSEENQGNRSFLSSWIDITERKKMEDKILELYNQEKKQRQELQEEAKARGLFIDVLAHELRTPQTDTGKYLAVLLHSMVRLE